ncbi:hypothetical protein QWZ10_09710 [Paracoccus cavernae]|uniref:Uncharacterized protein n=1 Tax=Paracoccus cavernae TaxID=1571207 RepID=A0ABT8D9B3_9RHOB|nr:hypothetical protein [Paracoccus cavernae]
MGFFDRIGGDGVEGLFDIPGAAGLRIAQRRHNGAQTLDLVGDGVDGREPACPVEGCSALDLRLCHLAASGHVCAFP